MGSFWVERLSYNLKAQPNAVYSIIAEYDLSITSCFFCFFFQKIIEEEAKEGFKFRMDKKSLLRLIRRLEKDGQIRSLKTIIKLPDEEDKEVLGTVS